MRDSVFSLRAADIVLADAPEKNRRRKDKDMGVEEEKKGWWSSLSSGCGVLQIYQQSEGCEATTMTSLDAWICQAIITVEGRKI